MTPLLLAIAMITAEPRDSLEKPDEKQRKLLKTFREEFIHVTPGKGKFPAEFMMGETGGERSAGPAHKVQFRYEFQIAAYEVPQNLWEAVMGKNPSRWKGPRNSVEMLSFDEAVDFCQRTTRLLRAAKLISDKQVVRLPSETEWEYCARAGSTSRYSFGDDAKELGAYAWFTGNAAGNDPPVGAKKPNPWGLYDVHGYLWEWCADAWHETYEGAPTDGSAWEKGGDPKRRVLRSGSWKDKAELLTSGFRLAKDRSTRDDAIGFRCVLAEK